MSNQIAFTSGSVRDREVSGPQTDGMYAVNGDYSNAVFGTLRVVGTIQSPTGFKYRLFCDPALNGCGCQGQVISAKELASTKIGAVKCANSGCGKTSTDQRRRFDTAPTDVMGLKPGAQSSARSRYESAQRQKEIAELDGGAQ